MAESIADLHVAIRASADKLASDISRDMKSQQAAIQAKAVALGTVIAAGITAGLAGLANSIKGAVNMGLEGLDRIDALDEAASKIGFTYNGLQDLKFAAETTGGSFEGMVKALGKMQANIATGDANDALSLLRLDVESIRKLAPEKQFAEISEALSRIGGTGEKLDLTKQIFGKGGMEIMNVINQGKAGLTEMGKTVQALGGHLTGVQRTMVTMAYGDIETLREGWGYVKDQIAVGIAPALTMITKQVLAFAQNVGGIGPLVQRWVDSIVSFGAGFATVVQYVGIVVSAIQTVGTSIGAVVALMEQGFKTAFKVFEVGLATAKIGIRQMAVEMVDAILKAINYLKDSALTTLNKLAVQADVIAGEIAKSFTNDAGKKEIDRGINIRKKQLVTYEPDNIIADLPTSDNKIAGGPEALLFPGGPEGGLTVDYTGLGDEINVFQTTATESFRVIGDAATETGDKMTDAFNGQTWGKDIENNYNEAKQAAAASAAQQVESERLKNEQLRQLRLIDASDTKAVSDLARDARIKAALDAASEIERANKQVRDSFKQTNQQTVTDMVTAWATGTGKISDIVGQWANRMIQQFIQLSLFGAGGKGGIVGSLMGGLMGGGGGWAQVLGKVIGGFFADGGRPPMGKVSVVGEKGPELFVPDTAGRIIPNNKASGFAGGGGGRSQGGGGEMASPIVINQTFQTGVTHADLAGAMDQMQDATKSAVYDGVRRGGGFRKGMQS